MHYLIENWRANKDPIETFRQWLLDENLVDGATQATLDTEAQNSVRDSVAYGETGAVPPEDIGASYMFSGVYS